MAAAVRLLANAIAMTCSARYVAPRLGALSHSGHAERASAATAESLRGMSGFA